MPKPEQPPKSWSELKKVTRLAREQLKEESRELDRRKCRVKRGMLEEEVNSYRGVLKV